MIVSVFIRKSRDGIAEANGLMTQKRSYGGQYTIPQQIEYALQRKRLVFTITPGRSGTEYLSEMLRFVPNVASYHEPEPKFSHVMRSVQTAPEIAYDFWIRKKLPRIVNESASIYIETSHLFCKGFIEPLLDLGITPDLIILTRPRRQVAMSMYELNTIPGRTLYGLRFLLNPDDPNVLPLPGWQKMHGYQLCYWYCLETERRTQIYRQLFLKKRARVVETSFHEITTPQGIERLIEELDLPMPNPSTWQTYLKSYRKKINTKTQLKAQNAKKPIQDIDYLEQNVLNISKPDFANYMSISCNK